MSVTTHAPVRLGGEPARTRAQRRWRTWRWPLAVLGAFLLVVLAAAVIQPQTSSDPLAVDNPQPSGARALAQVLGDQGVRVHETRSVAEAVRLADAGTTLAVLNSYLLTDADLGDLAATKADLVLIAPEYYALARLTADQVTTGWSSQAGTHAAGCTDPDAAAAGEISAVTYTVTLLSGPGVMCFADPADPSTGAYAVVRQNGRAVRILADARPITNEAIVESGNAALALRALGKHEQLIWLRATLSSSFDSGSGGVAAPLPPAAGPVTAWAILLILVIAVWRGRAFGRVVSEPLPVVVRAGETTRGRGRLYRLARSRGHAGASLRAGTIGRCAARVGLPRTADAPAVIAALSAATGRPTDDVAALLYGPPPSDDAELLGLARALDQLESEVHRT